MLLSDYEDDEWPENLGESKLRATSSATPIHMANDSDTLKRTAAHKRIDNVLYNIGAILASIAAGFDIRLSGTVALHPHLTESGDKLSAIPSAIDNIAVDSVSNGRNDLQFTSSSGALHHTYHGCQTRYRPTVNFDIPIRFTESVSYDPVVINSFHDTRTTPSSDNRTTPSADSRRTTPSLSGASFFSTGSGGGNNQSPRKLSVEDTTSNADLALISLSPSTDRAFVEFQRQLSDVSSATFDASPWTTPQSTPQRHCIRFEDGVRPSPSTTVPVGHHRSPSVTSGCSAADGSVQRLGCDGDSEAGLRCQTGIPSPICPPPAPRRSTSQERHGSAERPVTLDIIPRPRPHAGILKYASPVHVSAVTHASPRPKVTPTPLEVTSEDGINIGIHSFIQSPPVTANASPRLYIDHRKNLLDIDVEGQKADGTKPLPARPLARELNISELEREFLH